MQWVNNLIGCIENISNLVQTLRLNFHPDELDENESFDGSINSNLFKNMKDTNGIVKDLKDKVPYLYNNLEAFGNKSMVRCISRFSTPNTSEIDLNDVLDNRAYLSEELLVNKYNADINTDVRITEAVTIVNNDKNSNKTVLDMFYIVNHNTINKSVRYDLTKDDEFSTLVLGDINCNIEITVPKTESDNYIDEINSLYNKDSLPNEIKKNTKKFPQTHYNNSSINIKNKELSFVYNKLI